MLLKYIDLFLALDEYPREVATPFGFRTRYVCNYLERRVRALKFKTANLNKICVRGCHNPGDECPIVSDASAVPSVRFDEDAYAKLGEDEQHEFFIAMLSEGFAKCARVHSIPREELARYINEFRGDGYRNAWTHGSFRLDRDGLVALLHCRLDPAKFVLQLELRRAGTTIFDQSILETLPDETIFAYRFKDVVLADDSIVVRSKFDKPTFTLPLLGLP
ncbi:MAG: hypothetical protein R3B36_36400 [Polyangiaceae bacterium]